MGYPKFYSELLRDIKEANKEKVSYSTYSRDYLGKNRNLISDRYRRLKKYYDQGAISEKEFKAIDDIYEPDRNWDITRESKGKQTSDKIGELSSWFEYRRDPDTGKIRSYYGQVLVNKELFEFDFDREQIENIYLIYTHSGVRRQYVAEMFPSYPLPVFNKILSVLKITKQALVPLHIREERSAEEIAEWKIRGKIKTSRLLIRLNLKGRIEREFIKNLRENVELEAFHLELMEMLSEEATKRSTIEIPIKEKHKYDATGRDTIVLFGDIHIGKFFPKEEDVNGIGMNKHIIEDRLITIAQEAANYAKLQKSPSVNLLILGDIFESMLPDGMHFNHVTEMDLIGTHQLKWAIHCFEKMILILRKSLPEDVEINIKAIGGNHDRKAKKRDQDYARSAAWGLFVMLEHLIDSQNLNNVKVFYSISPIFSFIIDDVNYIIFHGDNNLINRSGFELKVNHGKDQASYTVIAHGHYHVKKAEESGKGFIKLGVSSVCGNDNYSQNNHGHSTNPSFIMGNRINNSFLYTVYPLE